MFISKHGNAVMILSICFLCSILPANQLTGQNKYEIFALKFAGLNNKIPVSATAVGSTSTDSTGVNYMIWLLKGNNGKMILVDAGFTDLTINPDITYVRPDQMLRKMNILPEDITDIIVTHPHWDHIGGIDLFPNAMVWLQKDDYDYFVGTAWQKDGNNNAFNQDDVIKIVQRNLDGKLTLVNGNNIEILPGIKVCTGSKHTVGSQYVLIGSDDEQVLIASDNSWFYYNLTSLLPIPVTHSSRAYVKNLKRMKSMVKNPDLVIPGHDPLVFDKFFRIEENIVKIGEY